MVGMFASLTSGFPLLEILMVTLGTSVISSFCFTSSSSGGIKTHWTLLSIHQDSVMRHQKITRLSEDMGSFLIVSTFTL